MTTVEALKDLYVALGGDASDVANITTNDAIAEALAAIAPTAIASVLPKVTSSDNGKVLMVVSGKWQKANLPE